MPDKIIDYSKINIFSALEAEFIIANSKARTGTPGIWVNKE